MANSLPINQTHPSLILQLKLTHHSLFWLHRIKTRALTLTNRYTCRKYTTVHITDATLHRVSCTDYPHTTKSRATRASLPPSYHGLRQTLLWPLSKENLFLSSRQDCSSYSVVIESRKKFYIELRNLEKQGAVHITRSGILIKRYRRENFVGKKKCFSKYRPTDYICPLP